MKISLDTNVILDTIQDRAGKEHAERIMQMSDDDKFIRCYTSFLTMANTAYVLRKGRTKDQVISLLRESSSMCHVLSMYDTHFFSALKIDTPDFEDALQIACAESKECDVIITHDTKHFRGYTCIPVYTPEEFLSRCEGLS